MYRSGYESLFKSPTVALKVRPYVLKPASSVTLVKVAPSFL